MILVFLIWLIHFIKDVCKNRNVYPTSLRVRAF